MKMKSSVRLLNHIIKIMNLQQSLIIRDEQWNQSYEAYNFNINGYVKIEHLTMSHFLGN